MASPSSTLTTLRPDLSGSLEEFDLATDRLGFIGYKVLPVMDVASQAGTFGVIPVEQLLKAGTLERAPSAPYSRDTFTFTEGSYACIERGHEEPVDDRDAARFSNYFDAEVIAAQRASDRLLREAEKRVAAAIFNATTWTGATLTTAVSIPWTTLATAVPIDNIYAAKLKVLALCGMWPNTLICTRLAYMNLRRCAQITAAVASTGAGDSILQGRITTQQIAQALDIEQILVAGGSKNTAIEGQDAVFASVWDDTQAMLCRVARSNDIKEPCIGRVFHWGGDGSQLQGATETYRDETVRSDIYRVRHDVQEKILYAATGHRLTAVTA